jgi:hypothetical protein
VTGVQTCALPILTPKPLPKLEMDGEGEDEVPPPWAMKLHAAQMLKIDEIKDDVKTASDELK